MCECVEHKAFHRHEEVAHLWRNVTDMHKISIETKDPHGFEPWNLNLGRLDVGRVDTSTARGVG